MKFRKYMAIALFFITIAAIGIYIYRDTIARNVANTVLKDSDLAVTGLSINSIDANKVHFDELVLEWSSGARIRISGIVLPTKVRTTQSSLLKIDELELIPAGKSDHPLPIAAILTSILELPQNVPYPTVQIGRVITKGLPPLTDVSWESTNAGHLLRLGIGSFAVAAGIEAVEPGEHRVSITATTSDDEVAVALALAVERKDSRYIISGQSTTRTAPLLPVLHAVGMVPAKITAIDTLLWGAVNTSIPDQAQDPIQIEATLQSDGELALEYQIDDQSVMQIQVLTYAPTVTMVEYPSLDWRARIESSDMRISTASIQEFPLSVTALSCQAGISCTLQANIVASDITLGGLAIASANVSAPMTITVDEQTHVIFAANTTAKLRGVSNQIMTAESIDLTRLAGAAIHINADGWSGRTDEARFRIEGIAAPPGFVGSLTTTLSNMLVSESDDIVTGEYHIDTEEAQLSFGGLLWEVPDITGTWKIANDKLSSVAVVSSVDDAIQAKLELTHNLDASKGEMRVRDASIDFAARNLSKFVSPAPGNWGASAGRLSMTADLNWSAADDYEVIGNLQVGVDGVAAFRDDIALAGLTTALRASFNTQTGYDFEPATVSLDLLEVGLPINEIMANFRIGADLLSVQVGSLSMGILGGTVRVDPFNYSQEARDNAIVLKIESVQLSLMKALAKFDSIDIEGSVSGVLPVTINGDQITITRGQLESDDPGGFIRYRAGDAGTDDSQLGLATRALSDFEFASLTSEVTYTEDGDLLLAMRLEGVNPQIDPNQPVVLNLNVENNVPQMLQSLQATRDIQEIFERHLQEE